MIMKENNKQVVFYSAEKDGFLALLDFLAK